MSYRKEFIRESRADILRRHKYGVLYASLLNAKGNVAHTVTIKPDGKVGEVYFVHTKRRMIGKFESLEALLHWAKLSQLTVAQF